MLSLHGYGASPRCSPLQQQWHTSHPTFRAVTQHNSVREWLRSNPLAAILSDPSCLSPPVCPSLWSAEPSLSDYIQLPLHLWIPDYFFPHLVPFVPCPVPDCFSHTSRRRWHSGGPRLIHGVHSGAYLHCWEYSCSTHNKTFSAWDEQCLARLPASVAILFRFVLTKEEGVTLELYNRIIEARVSGSSLHALRRELLRNRRNRMYETIASYYQHCRSHQLETAPSISSYFGGRGHRHDYKHMPPELHNPDAYYDHEPPSIDYMSELTNRHCSSNSELWTRYTQQLTGDRVCIDATFKVAKRLDSSSSRMLWSMMDLSTGCILHQQLLTHERHADVLPMFVSYAARCRELEVPLPHRVCSDRGLMDANVIKHPDAFPDAHINVDPWHFHALFTKTLNKQSSVWTTVSQGFKRAMYTAPPDGKDRGTHAEPQDIVSRVDALIKHYSHSGTNGHAAVTQSTKTWWEAQKPAILDRRICSHPFAQAASTSSSQLCMSSSPLENYHRQLNRLMRIVRCRETTMHGFLLHYMFRWNVDRRRDAKQERDWGTYDVLLVESAYRSCVQVAGDAAGAVWSYNGKPFALPPRLITQEQFGLRHHHVTLSERMALAGDAFPLSDELLHRIIDQFVFNNAALPTAQLTRLATASNDEAPLSPASGEEKKADSVEGGVAAAVTVTVITGGAVHGPQRRMTAMEQRLLAEVMQCDPLMREAVHRGQWDIAASRWNSFIQRCTKDPTANQALRAVLHAAHGEVLQTAVAAINKRRAQQMEYDLISMKASLPTITWSYVTPGDAAISMYEDAVLVQLVTNHTTKLDGKKARIDWKALSTAWLYRYRGEEEAGAVNRVRCRSEKVLKSHHQALVLRQRRQTEAAAALPPEQPSASAMLPAASAGPAIGCPATQTAASSSSATSSLTPPTASTALTAPAAPTSSSSAASCVMQWLRGVSGQASSSLSAAASSPPSQPAPHSLPPPAPLSLRPGSAHWSTAATAKFKALFAAHNYRWTYEQFNAVWPQQEFGFVSNQRWVAKNRIERTKRARVSPAEQTVRAGKRKRK